MKGGTEKRNVLLIVVKKSMEELWALQRMSRGQTPLLGSWGTKAKIKTDLLSLFDRRVQYYDQQIFKICKLNIKLHARNIGVSFYHAFSVISIPQSIVSLLPTSFFPVFSMANKSSSSSMFRLHCSSHIDTGTYWSVTVMLKLVPHHKKGVGNYPQSAPHKDFFSCILPKRTVNLLRSFTLWQWSNDSRLNT